MEVDEPYAEYVAARWSMLYRLAALLVGEPGADDLTQAALVAAYVDWADVRDAPSADDHVKRILARTAGRLAGHPSASPEKHPQQNAGQNAGHDARQDAGHGAGDPEDSEQHGTVPPTSREQLWGRFEELAPRQRIMVVLRGYEALDEAEIGSVLGCSAATVAAEVGAWDGQVDASVVREELIARADRVEVPLPPIDTLIERGRQLRRRRTGRRVRWTVLAALVVVTGLALTSVLQGMASDPSGKPVRLPALPRSLADLPKGHPPRISYSEGTTLHLSDGRKVPLLDIPTALATTRSGMYVALPPGRIVRIDFDTGSYQIVTDSASGQLVSDPAGSHVAWLTPGAGKAWVTVASVGPAGGALLGRDERVPTNRCCNDEVVLDGLDGSDVLVVSVPADNHTWTWDTGHSARPGSPALFRDLTGLGNGVVSQVTAGEVVARYGASHFAAGEVSDSTFLVDYELNARQADFADPVGDRVLYVDDAGETHVLERRTHGHPRTPENVRLQVPLLPDGYTSVRWEDADHVLLDVIDDSAPRGALVRCDVHTGRCALVVRFTGPHVLAS